MRLEKFHQSTLYIKRSGYNMMNVERPDNAGKCQSGDRLCGGSNKEKQTCIKTSDPCPITDIRLSPINSQKDLSAE